MTPTPNHSVLVDLLARVEEATGADRELDGRVWEALVAPVTWMPLSGPVMGRQPYAEVPTVTASLDALMALIEHHGFGWQIDQTEGAFVSDDEDTWGAICATPALSGVAALLKGLIAQHPDYDT